MPLPGGGPESSQSQALAAELQHDAFIDAGHDELLPTQPLSCVTGERHHWCHCHGLEQILFGRFRSTSGPDR